VMTVALVEKLLKYVQDRILGFFFLVAART
jgi:hypothetical protein